MSLADQDRSSTIKVRSRKGTLRRLPHTSPSSLLSYPRTYLIILLAVPTPLAHVACDSRLGPRSSPCRLDAIVLKSPPPYCFQTLHPGFKEASGALLTITSPLIGRQTYKVEISSFSPCIGCCLLARGYFPPMVEWSGVRYPVASPHFTPSSASIWVRNNSRPAPTKPQ
jgi:hypothetical protein